MLKRTELKTKNGRDIYVNQKGIRYILPQARGKFNGRIPNGIFVRFIKPAKTRVEKLIGI